MPENERKCKTQIVLRQRKEPALRKRGGERRAGALFPTMGGGGNNEGNTAVCPTEMIRGSRRKEDQASSVLSFPTQAATRESVSSGWFVTSRGRPMNLPFSKTREAMPS